MTESQQPIRAAEDRERTDVQTFRETNEAAKVALRRLVTSGNAFVLVGAGSSKRLKFPLWDEFLLQFFSTLNTDEQELVRAGSRPNRVVTIIDRYSLVAK